MAFHRSTDPDYWEMGHPTRTWMATMADKMGMKFASLPLGNPDDSESGQVSILHMPPGYRLWRHKHDAVRIEVVIKGSIETPEGTLRAGDVMVSDPGEPYGPHVAGPDGVTTVEIFGSTTGVAMQFVGHPGDDVVQMFEGILDDPDPNIRSSAEAILAAVPAADADTTR